MSYLFFDVETAGLPNDYDAPSTDTENWPRVVQIAWTRLQSSSDSVGEVTCHIIRPDGFTIPPDATSVHGITTEQALTEGVPLEGVLKAFLGAVEATDILVAHNAGFDASVVGAEVVRHKGTDRLRDRPSICTMKQSTSFCALPGKYGYKWPTLQELHEALFDCPFDDAHDAGADVNAGARCFLELLRRGIIDGQ